MPAPKPRFPADPKKGDLLGMQQIMDRTGFPEGTIRSRYHRGRMTCLWKLGRYLVAWENDLKKWMDEQQRSTTKTDEG